MNKPETISLYKFFKQIPDEEASRLYFENKRWSGTPVCGHCGSSNVSECKDHKPMAYRCKDCRKHFSVRTGTVLAESRLGLHKWLMAIYMMTTARKGTPSTLLARELGITQKSAWFLSQRIRETWLGGSDDSDTGDHVQVDECYIGGKESKKDASQILNKGRGAVGKALVIGLRDENGMVKAKVVINTTKKILHRFIGEHVAKGSTVVTDSFGGYNGLTGCNHITVNQKEGQYVKDMAHTKGIESFWALLKRGYIGVYHYMSVKHLDRYVNEFSFRHNTLKISTMDLIEMTINNTDNKHITYKELIYA